MPIRNIKQRAGDAIGVLQQRAVEERALAGGRGVDDEEIEAQRGDDRLDPDLGRAEPVLQFAAVEQHLHRADRQAQRREAEPIEAFALRRPRVVDKDHDPGGGEHAGRQVDEEHPAPAVIVGQPAAERRPDDRPEDHAHAPDRHRLGVPLGRVDVQQHRLRQRHQRRAAHALQEAERHDLEQRSSPRRTRPRRA
jgi:hypothetical protein